MRMYEDNENETIANLFAKFCNIGIRVIRVIFFLC
jgi:hypothetical protein